jgi:hypothetical protein
MYQVVPLAHVKDGQSEKSQADEIEVPPEVLEFTCAFVLKGKSVDLSPPYFLLVQLSIVSETNHIYAVTCLNQCLCLTPDAWVSGIVCKSNYRDSSCHESLASKYCFQLAQLLTSKEADHVIGQNGLFST